MHDQHRLRRSADFEAVRRQGRRWSHPLVTLAARPNDVGTTRCGFSVSRRIGKAVVRNRVRRRLREIVRRALTGITRGWDVVLTARAPAAEASYAALEAAVHEVFERARLMEPMRPTKPAAGWAAHPVAAAPAD